MPWVRVPVIEPMELRRANVYEHTPLNPYGGEYPRFLRPIGHNQPQWKWEFRPEPVSGVEASDKPVTEGRDV